MLPFSLDPQRFLLHHLKEDCDGKQEGDRGGPVREAAVAEVSDEWETGRAYLVMESE
jgi:hypothetical protein